MSPFHHPSVRRLVRLALAEDIGRGDVTTASTVPPAVEAVGVIVARSALVVAGGPIVAVVVEEWGASTLRCETKVTEGTVAAPATVVCEIRGAAAEILAVERVLLNFLQRLSGVATLTRRYAEAVAGTRARIVDTRKTIPGWRLLDKYAVRVGGGTNHRFGLDDGILIKDNHIAAAGGVRRAVESARASAGHLSKIEVECETASDVDEALAAGADVILLDNMECGEIAAAVQRIAGRARSEASGGVTLANVREIAETGVDWISVGALTHSAPAVDLALDLTLVG